MVLHVPFLRWDSVGNPSTSSSRTAFYYLETADGQQVIAALALCTEDNRLIYRAFNQFVEEYQDLLLLGSVIERNYVFQLNTWLDDIVILLCATAREVLALLVSIFVQILQVSYFLMKFSSLEMCLQVLLSSGISRVYSCLLFLRLGVLFRCFFTFRFACVDYQIRCSIALCCLQRLCNTPDFSKQIR